MQNEQGAAPDLEKPMVYSGENWHAVIAVLSILKESCEQNI